MGEIEKQDDTQPGRYDHIDKINIQLEEPGTEELCHQLLQYTEKFGQNITLMLANSNGPQELQ